MPQTSLLRVEIPLSMVGRVLPAGCGYKCWLVDIQHGVMDPYQALFVCGFHSQHITVPTFIPLHCISHYTTFYRMTLHYIVTIHIPLDGTAVHYILVQDMHAAND